MIYWKVGVCADLPWVYETSKPDFAYPSKLDALEHQRRDLLLLAEEIEDKLLEVRQEIHRLKGER